jgi:hypothetical protein
MLNVAIATMRAHVVPPQLGVTSGSPEKLDALLQTEI